MIRKIVSVILAIAATIAALGAPTFAAAAAPTASTVFIDGQAIAFDAYNILGNNYFKLRDLAFSLTGTPKQFDVGWDAANNEISLTGGRPYAAVGGEMAARGTGAMDASPTDSKTFLDGREVQFSAYNIGGYNYYRLRDVGAALGFGVDWDGDRDAVVVDTSKAYSYDQELIGFWHGRFDGWDDYFDFRADGAFSRHIVGFEYIEDGASYAQHHEFSIVNIGAWHVSDGRISFSDVDSAQWSGGINPPSDLEWSPQSGENSLDLETHALDLESGEYGVRIGGVHFQRQRSLPSWLYMGDSDSR